MLDLKVLAENIKNFRKLNGYTQNEVAVALQVSAQSVSKWECGISSPDIEKICRLSALFHVSIERLIGSAADEPTFVGVDAGGTKTEFCLVAKDGRVLRRLMLPGCNPNQIGVEKTVDILESGINLLFAEYKSVCCVAVGGAGFASGNHREVIENALRQSHRQIKFTVSTDILNVTDAATNEQKCVAAICGTGIVVYLKNGDNLRRFGGWGYLLDEGGSGYHIGRDALQVALSQRDGFITKSIITDLLEERFGGSVWNSISEIYKGQAGLISSLAPAVFKAYELGDAAAKIILEKNAGDLARLINSAAEYDAGAKQLIMAGSVIEKSEKYYEMVKSRINPRFVPMLLSKPPVYGAVKRALRFGKVNTDGIEENFEESYSEISAEERGNINA